VLRLSPDRLVIALSPDHVAWAVLRRGLRSQLHAKGMTKFAVQDGRVWQQALQILQGELPRLPVTKGKVAVVLSNAFVRYLLVNGGEALAGAEERLVLAKHDFLKVYGAVAQGWEIRISDADAGGKYLASAVDAELIAQLRQTFSATGFKLDSIQPYFALAFDAWCTKLDSKISHGIFIPEANGYCYAGIGKDEWQFMRSGRWEENDPAETFRRVIAREAVLSGDGQRSLRWCPAPDKALATLLASVQAAKPLAGIETMRDLTEPEYALVLAGAA